MAPIGGYLQVLSEVDGIWWPNHRPFITHVPPDFLRYATWPWNIHDRVNRSLRVTMVNDSWFQVSQILFHRFSGFPFNSPESLSSSWKRTKKKLKLPQSSTRQYLRDFAMKTTRQSLPPGHRSKPPPRPHCDFGLDIECYRSAHAWLRSGAPPNTPVPHRVPSPF